MAVTPVEYIKDSSTPGFAKAGDTKDITKPDANKIKKDVEQGNTNKLTNPQADQLERLVDLDTIEYTAEERRNVGKNAINAKNISGDTTGNAVGTTAGAVVGSAANIVANEIGQNVQNKIVTNASNKFMETLAKNTKIGFENGEVTVTIENPGEVNQAAQKAEKASKIPYGAVVAGGIALAGATMSLVSANKFDNEYDERIAQLNAAGDTNTILQNNYDKMGSDMDSMNEESEQFIELLGAKTKDYMDTNAQVAQLQAQYNVYMAQGNKEMADQIMSQIKALQEGDEGGEGDELTALQERLEEYSCSNAEAMGVAESGNTVSEFLKAGKALGIVAAVQCTMMTVAALLMLKSTYNAISAAFKVPPLAIPAATACAIAGAAMLTAANVMTAASALKMLNKSKAEFDCYSAGDEMAAYVATLQENISAQADFVSTTSGQYEEGNAAYEETVAEGEEGLKEGAQQQQNVLNGIMKPKPGNNGNSDKKPAKDKA